MFIPAEVSLTTEHEIHPDLRGMSDHAPLTITLPGPDSEVPVTHWSIQSGTDEEQAYLGEVLESLEALLMWEGQTAGEVDEVVEAISSAFSKAWDSQAKETRRGKHSNGWWTQECSDSIAVYHASHDADDWADYRRVMRAAKRDFFDDRINHVASIHQRTWDLMAWTRKRNLPTYEAISYRGVPCNSLESLWEALDGSYNAAVARPVDLSFLHPVPSMPLREWVPFSSLELSEALVACAHNSSPGPDHIMWSYLKYWCGSKEVVSLFTRVTNACICTGHWPAHFKESLSVIIPKPGKASYSTPKSFRPIVLLNTLGKLVEKMLARRLQFDGVAHNAFEPNQFGGVAQRSTKDAGIYLTHLVQAGWAKGLQTSVVAFNIAQFFPSLNHEVLFDVFSRMGFPAVLGPFLRLYLVGRRTTYKWDSFTSDPFAVDVGVGQGSAMSPVLSALYLTLIMRRFRTSDIGHKVDLMSYVDDGTIIAQSRRVEDNLPLLKEAYRWLFRAFKSLGLVLEHDKSEVFHFSCARSFVGPAIDLGYAPYTGTTPLRPKPIWWYLGFFFNRKHQFKEHARFYTTRAFTQVCAMGMLGNSVRGLEPDQKHLLYRLCVVPIITYGFCLWYFKGARVKGLIKAMSQVQHTAVRWICGNFQTTPGGGAECLSGLLPMHLTLRRLADRGTTRVPMLARSHPLRTILGEAMEGCHQAHPLALANSGPLSVTSLQGAAVDMAVGASALWQDEYDPFGPDSQPGNRVVDLFQSRFHRHGPASKKDKDIAKYRDQLYLAWVEAYVDVHLWFVPSRMEWGVQKAAHDDVVSLKIAVGRRPRTSRDFLRQRADVAASKDWCELFKDPSYHGHSFLDLLNSKDKPLQPSTRKGGPWLSESRVGPSTFSRLCRCITGHAPLGAYRQRFNISGPIHCSCRVGHGILETRSHALHSCPRWKHPGLHSLLDNVPTLTKFVQANAAFCVIVRPRLAWDPG
jgi:hypothetical protein